MINFVRFCYDCILFNFRIDFIRETIEIFKISLFYANTITNMSILNNFQAKFDD